MGKLTDFKRLAGMSPSRPTMSEAKETPAKSSLPTDIIGTAARTTEILALGELKLGISSNSAFRAPPEEPAAAKDDPAEPLPVGSSRLIGKKLVKKTSTSESASSDEQMNKEARDRYYVASGRAHVSSELAHSISGHVRTGEMPNAHQAAYDAHKDALDGHTRAQDMMRSVGLGVAQDLHDAPIAAHQKAMEKHGKKLGM